MAVGEQTLDDAQVGLVIGCDVGDNAILQLLNKAISCLPPCRSTSPSRIWPISRSSASQCRPAVRSRIARLRAYTAGAMGRGTVRSIARASANIPRNRGAGVRRTLRVGSRSHRAGDRQPRVVPREYDQQYGRSARMGGIDLDDTSSASTPCLPIRPRHRLGVSHSACERHGGGTSIRAPLPSSYALRVRLHSAAAAPTWIVAGSKRLPDVASTDTAPDGPASGEIVRPASSSYGLVSPSRSAGTYFAIH